MDATPDQIVAPAAWQRIDFISDLHLSEDTPRTFDAWRHYLLNTTADAVFILGDLFEAWVGDDSRFDGFEARGTDVLTRAAARRHLAFMVGNRDFLVGAEMLRACGIRPLQDPTVLCAFGERTLLTHGDAWCLDDTDYQRFRRQVRDRDWQAQVLAQPLALRRTMARNFRSESERKTAAREGEWVDIDRPTAREALYGAQAATLIHGHTHRPATETIAPGLTRHVLSDWDVDHGTRAEVLRWQADGWSRLTPIEASA